jgi:hypothetical protein
MNLATNCGHRKNPESYIGRGFQALVLGERRCVFGCKTLHDTIPLNLEADLANSLRLHII